MKITCGGEMNIIIINIKIIRRWWVGAEDVLLFVICTSMKDNFSQKY